MWTWTWFLGSHQQPVFVLFDSCLFVLLVCFIVCYIVYCLLYCILFISVLYLFLCHDLTSSSYFLTLSLTYVGFFNARHFPSEIITLFVNCCIVWLVSHKLIIRVIRVIRVCDGPANGAQRSGAECGIEQNVCNEQSQWMRWQEKINDQRYEWMNEWT